MLTGGGEEEKQEALIVSWSSLERRKKEYEELVNKKIPENSKDISIARSYGDLRENFEYKSAKEMQAVLLRRKAELEQMLSAARGTAFEDPDTSQVGIGTVVTLEELPEGTRSEYMILGAWDSDPEKHVLSYQTAIGQALLGKKPGEEADLTTDHGPRHVRILQIRAFKPGVDYPI
jgi:transcription elongation factor GreA